MSEAEDFLAELWCRLEEHKLEAPSIKVKTGSNGMVNLRLSFPSREAAALALERTSLPFSEHLTGSQATAAREDHARSS
jgi:hypothetical protein